MVQYTYLNYDTKGDYDMGFLEGKVAIITGGGRAVLSDGSCGSIGYGIATAYAKEGANLVLDQYFEQLACPDRTERAET